MARTLALLPLVATLCAPLASAAAPTVSMAPTGSASATVTQDAARKFREDFDQAQKLNSKSRMDELVRKNEQQAIDSILLTAQAVSKAPNEILLTRYEGLRDAWKRVYDTKFPDRLERFFSRLGSGTAKRQWLVAKGRYEELTRKIYELQKDPEANRTGLKASAERLIEMSQGFKEMGDTWLESQCLAWAAPCLDEEYQGKGADLDTVADAYERCLEARRKIGVKDATYRGFLNRSKTLTGLGYGKAAAVKAGGEAAGGGAPGAAPAAVAPSGPASAGEAVTAKMAFEELKILKDLQRPNYYLDEHRQVWPAVGLGGTGKTSEIPRVVDSPTILRAGSAKVVVDVGRDGKGDDDPEWPTRGKYENLVLELGSGAAKRQWAVLTEVGRQDDFYQGQPMNLLATDTNYTLYYIPGGCMKGEVNGVEVRVFDDNLDGIYGSPASAWQHMGLAPGTAQFELDSIRVGKEKKARPFSEYFDLGSAGWHRLESKDAGTSLVAEPVTLTTGTVQIKGKGVKPMYYVLRGVDETFQNTYIDVSGGKKVEIPVGRWELVFGLARKGKKMQAMKAAMLASESMERIMVKPGENTEIAYGAPYRFDFTYEVEGGEVTIDGKSVRIIGAGGEVYDRFYNCVPYVDAALRRKGAKRASGSGRLKPVVSNQGVEKHGWAGMWKPVIGDPIPFTEAEVEVQLVEKKNKLFGKVESDWK